MRVHPGMPSSKGLLVHTEGVLVGHGAGVVHQEPLLKKKKEHERMRARPGLEWYQGPCLLHSVLGEKSEVAFSHPDLSSQRQVSTCGWLFFLFFLIK